jgi:hypothetical protein
VFIPCFLGRVAAREPTVNGCVRCHCRHPDLGWAASPIRPDIIFGKDSWRVRFVLPISVSATSTFLGTTLPQNWQVGEDANPRRDVGERLHTRLWDTGDIVAVLEVREASNAKQIVSQMPRPENDHMP